MQAIRAASVAGNLDEVKRLVTDGADPSCVIRRMTYSMGYEMDETPIVSAIGGDHVHIVKYFVEECGLGEQEKTTALWCAISGRHTRCAAFLVRHGAMLPHGPFPMPIVSHACWVFAVHPLAFVCSLARSALEASRILQENAWTQLEMTTAFDFVVRRGRWALATCLFEAGALPIFQADGTKTTLELALSNAACPPDLRKMLWAFKISAEQATTVRLAWLSYNTFAICLRKFDDKIALLHGPVTRHMRLQVAASITPKSLWQSFLVKRQLPVTGKSPLMSYVLHEHTLGLPGPIMMHVIGFVGHTTLPTKTTLTGKILAGWVEAHLR